MPFNGELFGLGMFLFGATVVGQLLAARADVAPLAWFWVTVAWGAALGIFAALVVEEGQLLWRFLAAVGSGAAGFLLGTGITSTMARRGWLEDRHQRELKAFRRDVTLLGGAVCAAAGALAGGSGGYQSSGLSLVLGFFALPVALFALYIALRRRLPKTLLLLFGPNMTLGLLCGELIGGGLTML